MSRFHPALVILHWVIALLVIFSLIWGRFWVGHLSDDIDNKATIIKIHIGAGFTIFYLMIARVVFKKLKGSPAPVDVNAIKTNKLSKLVHFFLYVVIFSVCISGIVTAFIYGLLPSLFVDSDFLMPSILPKNIPSQSAHHFMANLLLVLVVVHISAALIHQFIWKDKLLSRMWFKKKQ